MAQLQKLMPPDLKITYACSTGYGEQLLKEALGLDEGEVETIAHTTAALFFDPVSYTHLQGPGGLRIRLTVPVPRSMMETGTESP